MGEPEPLLALLAVDLRAVPERTRRALSLDARAVAELLASVRRGHRRAELVVFADRDRFELYAGSLEKKCVFGAALGELLARVGGLSELAGAPVLAAQGTGVAHHLFRSAVGLDPGTTVLERVASMQRALARAAVGGTLGERMARLFESAIVAGWRAHGETARGCSPVATEWELERLELERLVEEELCAWRARSEPRASVLAAPPEGSIYPGVEPESRVRLSSIAELCGRDGKSVA